MTADEEKVAAAAKALDFVRDGMRLGIGTGTTAAKFVDLLGEQVKAGLNIVGVPTSKETEAHATRLGIPLTNLDDTPALDLTVDGADQLDEQLRLIKGGGGALLREKIVAAASAHMIVIADASKRVPTLGAHPLPVEVLQFGFAATLRHVKKVARDTGCQGEVALRMAKTGEPFITDGGNYILDCAYGRIEDPELAAAALSATPGVVEHGLFLRLASAAIVAGPDGVTILGEP